MRDPDGEQLSAPINWRWRLWAAPDTHFPADASTQSSKLRRS